MSKTDTSPKISIKDQHEPRLYEIRIMGHLGEQWIDWFGGMNIMLEDDGHTRLTGPVVDQAALHGLLRKVRDLAMPLISVTRIEPDLADKSTINQQ